MRGQVQHLRAHAARAHEYPVRVVQAQDEKRALVDVFVRRLVPKDLRVHLEPVRADVQGDEGDAGEEPVRVLAGDDHEEPGGGEAIGHLRRRRGKKGWRDAS